MSSSLTRRQFNDKTPSRAGSFCLIVTEDYAALTIIQQIAARADKDIFSRYTHISQSILTTEMDLSACHAQGCELDFERLLAAPAEDFEHDILGIRRHLNRETGYLEDFFVPRYAKAQY